MQFPKRTLDPFFILRLSRTNIHESEKLIGTKVNTNQSFCTVRVKFEILDWKRKYPLLYTCLYIAYALCKYIGYGCASEIKKSDRTVNVTVRFLKFGIPCGPTLLIRANEKLPHGFLLVYGEISLAEETVTKNILIWISFSPLSEGSKILPFFNCPEFS